MKINNDFEGLKHRKIIKVDTQLGYLQVLEYILQDFSYLHVVQWHFVQEIDKDNRLPKTYNETFYRDKESAMKKAHEIGNNLLQQYLI